MPSMPLMGRGNKAPTPQEMYRARKQREEEERTAFLPPGLYNHGNTCFMNSVLQGLVATPILADVVRFALPDTYAPILARRSPQLTNGHGGGGEAERAWEQGMPLGDEFIRLMENAWKLQEEHAHANMSPRDLLGRLGAKYDQYLDFRQQDAHELLRHLLDAMRMEELDIIKKRQPPPPKVKRRQKRKAMDPDSACSLSSLPTPGPSATPIPEEDRLTSFVDMVFGGRLASILVCEKCKKVSCTYEDFNDLSLSIRPEDHEKARRRGRLRDLARKLGMRGRGIERELELVEGPRSSSVPASPTHHTPDVDQSLEQVIGDADQRRRSLDEGEATILVSEVQEETHPENVEPEPGRGVVDERRTLGVVEENKSWKEGRKPRGGLHDLKEEDGWVKLRRRISVSVRKSRKKYESKDSKDRSSNDEGRSEQVKGDITDASMDLRSPPQSITASPILGAGIALPKFSFSRRASPSRTGTASPALSTAASPPRSPNILPSVLPILEKRSISPAPLPPPASNARPKQPRPPKPSREQSAYLRRLLADVPTGAGTPFSIFRSPIGGSATDVTDARGHWPKFTHVQSVEECLRMFTSVEVLDGENMVGCRRCWKIQQGEYVPRGRSDASRGRESQEDEDEDDGEDNDTGSDSSASVKIGLVVDETSPSQEKPATNSSSPEISSLDLSGVSSPRILSMSSKDSQGTDGADNSRSPYSAGSSAHSSSTLPTSLSVPSISMTAPEFLEPTSTSGVTPIAQASQEPTHSPTQIKLSPSPSRDSLRLPTVRHVRLPAERGRSFISVNSDTSSVSSDESSDDLGETETELTASVHSDSSSAASTSRDMDAQHAPAPVSSSSPSPGPGHPELTKAQRNGVPRAKQVVLRRAYKRYLIATPPPVLVVHLKRFQQVGRSPAQLQFFSNFKKLDDPVSVPEYLDLGPFLLPSKHESVRGRTEGSGKKKDTGKSAEGTKGSAGAGKECMYRLYAVVVHIGNMLGGHYVAYTALPEAAPILPTSPTIDAGTENAEATPSGSPSAASTPASSSLNTPRPEMPRTTSFTRTATPNMRSGSGAKAAGASAKRQWCYVSDTIVRLASLEEVLKAKAYICMYERV